MKKGVLMNENRQTLMKVVGQRLRELRISDPNYSDIKTLSRDSQLKSDILYKYERGQALPPLDNFLVLCKVFNKTPDTFLGSIIGKEIVEHKCNELALRLEHVKNNINGNDGIILDFINGCLKIHTLGRMYRNDESVETMYEKMYRILKRRFRIVKRKEKTP